MVMPRNMRGETLSAMLDAANHATDGAADEMPQRASVAERRMANRAGVTSGGMSEPDGFFLRFAAEDANLFNCLLFGFLRLFDQQFDHFDRCDEDFTNGDGDSRRPAERDGQRRRRQVCRSG